MLAISTRALLGLLMKFLVNLKETKTQSNINCYNYSQTQNNKYKLNSLLDKF